MYYHNMRSQNTVNKARLYFYLIYIYLFKERIIIILALMRGCRVLLEYYYYDARSMKFRISLENIGATIITQLNFPIIFI